MLKTPGLTSFITTQLTCITETFQASASAQSICISSSVRVRDANYVHVRARIIN